jgi:hypothetical protein
VRKRGWKKKKRELVTLVYQLMRSSALDCTRNEARRIAANIAKLPQLFAQAKTY